MSQSKEMIEGIRKACAEIRKEIDIAKDIGVCDLWPNLFEVEELVSHIQSMSHYIHIKE